MGLVDEINRSEHRIVDCVRIAAAWLGHIDHQFEGKERQALLERLPDRPNSVPLDAICAAISESQRSESYGELASVFQFLRERLSDDSKDAFLDLLIDMVAADGRVSVGERHGLAFLADLVNIAPRLPERFEAATGLVFDKPPDLSSRAYWEQLAAAQGKQQQHQRQQREQQHNTASTPDTKRIEALAVLGLTGNPSKEEIRIAYRRLAKIHHPDGHATSDAESIARATKVFQRIKAAYETLS